jgi:sec-independent protein translocase protein TatB
VTRRHHRLRDVFNFQGSELIIILLLALVVLGPEKLPEAMRRLGSFYADLKKMSTSFQDEFKAAVEEPVRELRDTANTLRDSADFQAFSAGERDEKPKSADMSSEALATPDPGVTPTDDVPFGDRQAPEPDADPPATSGDEPVAERSGPPPYPAPPPPFSSSQVLDAAAREDTAPEDTAPATTAAERSAVDPLGPQIAVDDESGLREARPLEPDDAVTAEDGER